MGPWILLVAVTVCMSVPSSLCKPLAVLTPDDLGLARRVRRSLPMANPYEANMMTYIPSESLRNEPLHPDISQAMLARLATYPQEELLARALERMGSAQRVDHTHENPTLQQLIEEGQRRDKETLYLANLLHLWNQLNQGRGLPEQLQGFPSPVQAEMDYQRPYQDYDEIGLTSSRSRPQVSRNQMAEASQSHYRQNRGFEGPALRLQPEDTNEDGYPVDEEMLRYIVTRVLSAMNEAEMPQRLGSGPTRRMRRSLDDEGNEDLPTNLLRVKRLEADNADYSSKLNTQRRPQHFTDPRLTEQWLKYFPE